MPVFEDGAILKPVLTSESPDDIGLAVGNAHALDWTQHPQYMTENKIEAFIERWQRSAASERANYALFLAELCDVLGVPRPEPATGDPDQDKYRFERPVQFRN